MRPGDDCVNAYAELRGRLKALELDGARTNVAGPVFATLSPSLPGRKIPGCDIWDFQSNGVSDEKSPARPAVVGFLVCGKEPNGSLGVRFGRVGTAGGVPDADQKRLVQDLQSQTSCAQARARLLTGFLELGDRSGASPIVRGPSRG